MTPESNEDPLDRVRSEIRAEADAARLRAPLPERMAFTGAGGTLPDGAGPVTIATLAAHAGPAFVDHAYRTILRRPPDAEGAARQHAALAGGANKIEVLGDLRYSAEGKRNAVLVAGLWPRYALAKLTRVPLLGAPLRWLIATLSLPHMLRHQRATEASLAVQFGETRAALQLAQQRAAELQALLDATRAEADTQRNETAALRSDLASAVAELSARISAEAQAGHQLRVYVESLSATVADLRQLALSMNHWTVQVRHGIDAIEAAETERRMRDDETAAALLRDARSHDSERGQRLHAWSDALAMRIPREATVLDLCGGADWIATLTAQGWNASSIETNSALHREARERGLNVTLGAPASLLARIADASFDAVTIMAMERLDAGMTAAELLREAQRILKPRGRLLIDISVSPRDAEFAPAALVRASGFVEPVAIDTFGGNALIAVRA